MPSSGEIAQMFASQQAAFASQNVFANQIGINAPGMGLGAYGGGGSWAGRFQQAPGGAPPAWSYAPTGVFGPGYGAGNQFAGNAMAGLGGLASAGGLGLGLAAGFGKFGPLGTALLDPFGSAIGGFRAAGGMAGGMGAFGAGALATLPSLGIGMMAGHAMSSFVHGAQQQAGINREMGQFNFFNAQSRTGSGFTRDDANVIGSRIRELAHIPEMMTSVEELTRLLPNLRKAGTFQGVKEITEFQTRFNDSIKTIKTMSKMLGTTMEQASEFFAHSTSVGFLGKQAQLQNTMNAQFTSGVTGLSLGQVMDVQRQGAQMGVQMGVGRRNGAQAVTNNVQRLGFAQQSGLVGEGELEDITGLEGPNAVAAAGTKLTQVAVGMLNNSAFGNLTMMGLAKFDSSGKAIGIDAEMLKRLKRGGPGVVEELKRRVSGLTNTQKISVKARSPSLSMLTAGAAGPESVGRVIKQLMDEKFGSDSTASNEALNMLMQGNGATEQEADIYKKVMGQDTQGAEDMARIRQREALIAEKYSPSAYWNKFKVALRNVTTAPFQQAGASVAKALGNEFDKFFDDVVGRHMVVLSKDGADSFAKALAGNSGEFRKELARLHGVDLDIKAINRQERYSAAGAINGLIYGMTLGTSSWINPNLRSQLDQLLEGDGEADEKAKKDALTYRSLGGDFKGVRAGFKAGKAGFLAGEVEKWQMDQTNTADRYDPTKMATGLATTFHQQIVDDMMRLSKPGTNRMLVEGAVSRGDMMQLTQLTNKTVPQLMAAGGAATKGALMARQSGGEGGLRGALGSLAAGTAMAGAGVNIEGLGSDLDIGKGPANGVYTQQELQKAQQYTRGRVESGIKGGNVLAVSGKARKALTALLGDEYAKDATDAEKKAAARFVDDIANADTDYIKKVMAKKYGIELNDVEAQAVKDAATQSVGTDAEGNRVHKDRTYGLIAAARKMDIQGDVAAASERGADVHKSFTQSVKDAKFAAGSDESKIAEKMSKALEDMGALKDGNDFIAKGEKVGQTLSEAIQYGASIKKDKKKYSKFLEGMGAFSDVVQRGVEGRGKVVGKNNVSFDDLARNLGVDTEEGKANLRKELDREGSNVAGLSVFNFTGEKGADKFKSIEATVAGMRSANMLAPSGAVTDSKSKDQQIIDTLKQMETTSKLQTSLLIVQSKSSFANSESLATALASQGIKTNEQGQIILTPQK